MKHPGVLYVAHDWVEFNPLLLWHRTLQSANTYLEAVICLQSCIQVFTHHKADGYTLTPFCRRISVVLDLQLLVSRVFWLLDIWSYSPPSCCGLCSGHRMHGSGWLCCTLTPTSGLQYDIVVPSLPLGIGGTYSLFSCCVGQQPRNEEFSFSKVHTFTF